MITIITRRNQRNIGVNFINIQNYIYQTFYCTPVHLAHWLNYPLSQSCGSSTMHTIVQIQVKRFSLNIRIWKKCDFSDFDCCLVVGSRWVGLNSLETADLPRFSNYTVSRKYTEVYKTTKTSSEQNPVLYWQTALSAILLNHRRMTRLVWADKKATVAQKINFSKSGKQKKKKKILKCT